MSERGNNQQPTSAAGFKQAINQFEALRAANAGQLEATGIVVAAEEVAMAQGLHIPQTIPAAAAYRIRSKGRIVGGGVMLTYPENGPGQRPTIPVYLWPRAVCREPIAICEGFTYVQAVELALMVGRLGILEYEGIALSADGTHLESIAPYLPGGPSA